MDFIFDNEPHALSNSDGYGYISNKFSATYSVDEKDVRALILKYLEYIYMYDKEKMIEFAMKGLAPPLAPKARDLFQSTNEDFQIIFKPATIITETPSFSILYLKFKRATKDDL